MVFIDDYDDESSSTVLRRLQPASAASDSSDVEASSIESMTGDHTEQEKLEETNLVEDSDHWQAVHDMAKRETKSIRVWRLVVILTLLVLGACISTLVYTILRAEEESDFNDTYFLFAESITETVESRFLTTRGVVEDFSERMTAYAHSSNTSFPFVTVDLFEVDAMNARQKAGADTLVLAPYVSESSLQEWGEFTAANGADYLEQSRNVSIAAGETPPGQFDSEFLPFCYQIDGDGEPVPVPPGREKYVPTWQVSPPPDTGVIMNLDLSSDLDFTKLFNATEILRESTLSKMFHVDRDADFPVLMAFATEQMPQLSNVKSAHASSQLHSQIVAPVFQDLYSDGSPLVAALTITIEIDILFTNLLPDGMGGFVVVLKNTCGDSASFELSGGNTTFLGPLDTHDSKFDGMLVNLPLNFFEEKRLAVKIPGHCIYELNVYPSQALADRYGTTVPVLFAGVVSGAFLFMICAFFVYDRFVERRNDKVVHVAARSNVIVSSLFPTAVRDRLLEQAEAENDNIDAESRAMKTTKSNRTIMPSKNDVKTQEMVEEDEDGNVSGAIAFKTQPIAELFPETTIMFADLAGFTAWSSSREPSQVFVLLESIYHAFDEIAHKRRVYKVETVGDCYVAVCGLPEPRKDHAIVMCRFARDCMLKMQDLAVELEAVLGPETTDLALRAGLHSGSVIGGVLRGERSRFQLFGDTMNTASRMESTGKPGRVQISPSTANLLKQAGKADWYIPREEKIVAKGKGEMETFWLGRPEPDKQGALISAELLACHASGVDLDFGDNKESRRKTVNLTNDRISRLIEWNVDVLKPFLKQCIARRKIYDMPAEISKTSPGQAFQSEFGKTAIDEVEEVIQLPTTRFNMSRILREAETIQLDNEVEAQLRQLIQNIAALYNDHPFHSFEHASHVTMSVVQLLSRLVAPVSTGRTGDKSMTCVLRDSTYDFMKDPLTQFACIFSALAHDLDHPGVPNSQLVKEKADIAVFYRERSVAEQNSVEIAWNLLQDDDFRALRSAIHSTKEELAHFRQIVVNAVMATDVMDPKLNTYRNERWVDIFELKRRSMMEETINMSRKATAVLELLLQVSDVVHTMQHFQVYRKWNEKLFLEISKAHQAGRAKEDPSEKWYEAELAFFDYYVIPLAQKLKECGVFGVSSADYLNYATSNRSEWLSRGKEILEEMKMGLVKNESK